MNTDTDTGSAPQNEDDNLVDGGTPTPEEARLAQELADEEAGSGKGTDADAGDAAGGAAAAAGEAGADGADGEGGGAGDDDGAGSGGGDAGAAETAEPAKTADTPAAAPPPQPEAPVAPMDFDAEYAKNQKAFDEGEIDASAFQARVREISKAESGFIARTEIFKERQQTAAQQAQNDFATAAAAWEASHKDFMANPLRAKAMQDAINAIDAATPGMSPSEVLSAAEKVAFEAYGYKPPTADTDEADANAKRQAIADAKAGRKPAAVPATLGGTPTGAHVDTPTGSAFSKLDSMDIDSLENQVAHMSPDQVEAYLRDAPGAKATGH